MSIHGASILTPSPVVGIQIANKIAERNRGGGGSPNISRNHSSGPLNSRRTPLSRWQRRQALGGRWILHAHHCGMVLVVVMTSAGRSRYLEYPERRSGEFIVENRIVISLNVHSSVIAAANVIGTHQISVAHQRDSIQRHRMK